jgi:hypothetical protein
MAEGDGDEPVVLVDRLDGPAVIGAVDASARMSVRRPRPPEWHDTYVVAALRGGGRRRRPASAQVRPLTVGGAVDPVTGLLPGVPPSAETSM